jgi:hypothetical protein
MTKKTKRKFEKKLVTGGDGNKRAFFASAKQITKSKAQWDN